MTNGNQEQLNPEYKKQAKAVKIIKNNVVSLANSRPENAYDNMMTRGGNIYANQVGLPEDNAVLKDIFEDAKGEKVAELLAKYFQEGGSLFGNHVVDELNKLMYGSVGRTIQRTAQDMGITVDEQERALLERTQERGLGELLNSKFTQKALEDISAGRV